MAGVYPSARAMAPINSTSALNASDLSGLAQGWVPQTKNCGTLSILMSCITTIFLCSWSVLCLNIPETGRKRWGFLKYKLRWQLFAIFFPEVVTSMAAEQWESANQSVQEFTRLGYPVDDASRIFCEHGWIPAPKPRFSVVSCGQ